ncbi:DUF2513 domain-containing protein [Sporomusa sp. KB1]|jgi:hypothetical protein|uniref:DUF2513 domain-containing protein n=1 Tax=Sporomusa sp. KB1 TaxID=943346 RepID=UPI0011A2ABA7|nr:DUF2513 domain-containing protein [Sporomusa sp. KB1]TWH49627.1 uncharacterized protein DUF2513 [Sporomusa sp. KB1]
MQRDLELIRNILLKIESLDKRTITIHDLGGITTDEFNKIGFHLRLLMDCNYIEAIDLRTKECDNYVVKRITSLGYDYLDNIRDNKVWKETKSKLTAIGSSASLEIIKLVAGKAITNLLGI